MRTKTQRKKVIEKHKSRLTNITDFPLSKIEKMWLKSIYSDPRIRLFLDENAAVPCLDDVEPLFDWDDFVLFDKYNDGDPYENPHYIEMFRKILQAIKYGSRLKIEYRKKTVNLADYSNGSKSDPQEREILVRYIDPEHLEYSERDDRFRLIGNIPGFRTIAINVVSIVSCEEADRIDELNAEFQLKNSGEKALRSAVFELEDNSNALERFLLNFSHYEKVAERLDKEGRYRITIAYDETDEKDMVIRVLSFGPYVKAVSPDCFVELIKDRLRRQNKMIVYRN